MRLSHFTRSDGHSSVEVAAHHAGEALRDERASTLYDYSQRRDVVHAGIVVPGSSASSAGPAGSLHWATDRNTLWNAVESGERERIARVATEIQVSLPRELSPEARVLLARSFSQELADRYRVAVDLSVHSPGGQLARTSHHAHLLLTHREVSEAGLGAVSGLGLGGNERAGQGLGALSDEYRMISDRWSEMSHAAVALNSRDTPDQQASVDGLRQEVRAAWKQLRAAESAQPGGSGQQVESRTRAVSPDEDYHV